MVAVVLVAVVLVAALGAGLKSFPNKLGLF